MAGLLALTRRELGRTHLVRIAATLSRELHLGIEELRALRLPVDLLDLFPGWQAGSTEGLAVPRSGLTLHPESAARPIRDVRLHACPSTGTTPILLTILRDLSAALDPTVRFLVLLDPDTDAGEFRRMARAVAGTGRVRLAMVDVGTVFARDNAMGARDARGRSVLVIPRALRTATESAAAPLDRRAAARTLGVRVVPSRLYWHGGNILFDGDTLAVGADTIAENVTRLGLSRREVIAILAAEFGHDVTVLGDPARGRFDEERNRMSSSGQASYHIDLDVALLGRTATGPLTALVADARAGAALVSGRVGRGRLTPPYATTQAARRLLDRDYRLAARASQGRLDAYSRVLTERGYQVVRVPQPQTRGADEGPAGFPGQDFVYCNLLPGLNRGRPAIHYTPWGVARLDRAAVRAFKAAGVHPVPVGRDTYLPVAMMDRAAGLRCFCGTMG